MDIFGAIVNVFCAILSWALDRFFDKQNESKIIEYSHLKHETKVQQENHITQSNSLNNNKGTIYSVNTQSNDVHNHYNYDKQGSTSNSSESYFIFSLFI